MRWSRRKTRRRRLMVAALLLAVVAAASGWWYFGDGWPAPAPEAIAATTEHEAVSDPVEQPAESPLVVDMTQEPFVRPGESEAQPGEDEVLEPIGAPSPALADTHWPGSDQPAEARDDPTAEGRDSSPAVQAAHRHYAEGRVIEARHALNASLRQGLSRTDQAEARRFLTRVADDTVFSKRRLPNDPLVETYTVQSGDALVRIGRAYNVPAEILMRINGIRDATKLRADQTIKVVRGPFHARIYKSEFRLDVYLQDLYVRSFRVALGAEQSTPEGVWRVKERLENPTYYPSPSAEDKRIIAADDPQNPLGEHWIGLEGIRGDAEGQYGYGIHGTIEPESIGKAVSLGCVRMHNEDVAFLYALLLPGQSTVTVLP